MAMTPLYVNARFLTQNVTGVQRFAREISLRLRSRLPDTVFLCPPDVRDAEMASQLGAKIVGSSNGHWWEQSDLPRYLRSVGSPLLLNLTSTAPVSYSNQIATLHDINFVRNPQSFSFQFRTFYRGLIPLILRRTKGLITVSEFSKAEIQSYYNFPSEKIAVVPNAVDRKVFYRPTTSSFSVDAPYLLAVSSTNYHKNFGRLIEAFSALRSDSNVNLYVVGGHHPSFSVSTVDASLSENVRFLGRVDDAELARLYANALAFVFPSLYEGFGIPPLEAQACGCPVLASSAASIPEVLRDSAIFFDPYDVSDITNALQRAINEPELRVDLVQRGFQNVARYSWEQSAQRVIETLDSLA